MVNNQHRQIEKLILRQMEPETLPIVPKNRHQRRILAKGAKRDN